MIYFKKNEFIMGNEIVYDKMDIMFLPLLDELRQRVGEPLVITSSYRSKDYNKMVGGASKSQHLYGKAVDLACNNGILRAKIVRHALGLGLTVGVAKMFVHVDSRFSQIVYTY